MLGQTMDNNKPTNEVLPEFTEEQLLKCRSIADAFFHRTVENDKEVVKFLPGSSIRIWYNLEDVDFPNHWHYAVEIIMPIKSQYTVVTQREEIVLNPYDILFIPAGEVHSLKAPKEGARLICLFDYAAISNLKTFSSLTPFLSQVTVLRYDETSPVYVREYNLIHQIMMEYITQNSFFELVIYARLLSFFVALGRYKMLGDKDYAKADSNRQKELSKKLAIAFEYIDAHYTEDVCLDDVAFVAGFSKFHFSRLFKQCSGQNLHEYLCFKRIKASEILLLKPELSITEIAFQSGFSSLSTFNRIFKSINNCSPTEYRNLCTKGSPGSPGSL